MNKSASSRLPSGDYFKTWEKTEIYTRELHVDINKPHADDSNDGSAALTLASISAAAAIAAPGTRVVIHEGVYRECVRPAMGGTDPENMISYESFQNDEVIIKASEEVSSFSLSTDCA
jgi:hypothetical protein